ncbi:peroxidase family protein [Jannaschia pohangensis]|uniref:Animal haem peroxidase n=1 Tax=Jannaschia pohangensis TaxID=390807 RepID=A0A1I3N4T2_9RHOB|nr:peroxidase family protein [Jannaschia pohangensis]SFJ04229.1 Animal haem peroxidase [Jannaschia pohangensis]
MLFFTGHGVPGQRFGKVDPNDGVAATGLASDAGRRLIATACGFASEHSAPDPMEANFGPLDFAFPDAPVAARSPDKTAAPAPRSDQTGFGRFVANDILAMTGRCANVPLFDGTDADPLPRAEVVRLVANLRTGALDLDSVYGGAALTGSFGQEMIDKLRCPRDRAKLAMGCDAGRLDLLRLSHLVDPARPRIDAAKLTTLPADLRAMFLRDDGSLQHDRAIIADARNANDPDLARLHLAFARLHNRIVDHADPSETDREALFDQTRDRVRWTYQWLVANAYLPAVCDPAILARVQAGDTAFFGAFHARASLGDARRMPLPLEFTLAAFRDGLPAYAPKIARRFNLPSAQGCLDSLAQSGTTLPRLDPGQIPEAAPLSTYIAHEAAILGQGTRLGPLGSYLVAEVLLGLVARGFDTYANRPHSEPWHPRDIGLPSEMPVDSLPALMRVAGLT